MTDTPTDRESVERLIVLYSRQYGNPTGGEKHETAETLHALLAERDALKAKLAVAVDAANYVLSSFDCINETPRPYKTQDVHLLVKSGSLITSISDARKYLALINKENDI